MNRKKISILLVMLLSISSVFPALGTKNISNFYNNNETIFYILDIPINSNDPDKKVLSTDTYEVYEGQTLTVTLTVTWDPPQPENGSGPRTF